MIRPLAMLGLGFLLGTSAYAQSSDGSGRTLVFDKTVQQPLDISAKHGMATGSSLTLKRAIELALQNSADLQLAGIQSRLAERSALITKAEFLPNLYTGSGA